MDSNSRHFFIISIVWMAWEKDSVIALLFYTNHCKENGPQSLKHEMLKIQGTKKP